MAVPALQKPFRAALITHSGGPHLSAYVPALAETTEVTQLSVSDPSGEIVPAAKKAWGSRMTAVYQDPAELFRKEKPNLALITMEAALSPPVIAAALDAGCHVLAEKPACLQASDFRPLVENAKSRGLQLVLALGNRIDPVIVEARRLVTSGAIGQHYGVESHIIADQTRLTRPAYHKTWIAQKARAGGGHLIWLGIHWIDLAMFVTGSPIQEVSAFTGNVGGQPIDTEDSAVVAMRFANGTFGTLTSGYYLDRSYHSMLKVWGSHGWLEVRKHTDNPLEWYSRKEPDPRVRRYEGPKEPSGYTPFVRHIVRSCLGLEAPTLNADDSMRALETVYACYRAAANGSRQRVSV